MSGNDVECASSLANNAHSHYQNQRLLLLRQEITTNGGQLFNKKAAPAASNRARSAGEAYEDDGGAAVPAVRDRPDAIDPALRRAGRFDREIALGIPDAVSAACAGPR